MKNTAGPPVEGEDFFGRTSELARLLELIDNHDVLLLGPRRIGKTSICRQVMEKVKQQNWQTVEINVASCQDERAVLRKLYEAVSPALATWLDKVKSGVATGVSALAERLQSVDLAGFGIELNRGSEQDWTQSGNKLLKLLAQAEQPWLIYVDELPIFLFNLIRNDANGGVQRVRRFLDWFRNDVRAQPDTRHIRWLLSGSVGLDTLVQEHRMADTINSLKHETLPAFGEDMAVAMLTKLAGHYALPFDAAHAISLVAQIRWPQPYYLQLAFQNLRALHSCNPDSALAELIPPAIKKLAEPDCANDFHHWRERLSVQLSKADAAHVEALLDYCAKDSQGVRPEMLLEVLAQRLPNDSNEEMRQRFIRLRDILLRDAYWQADETSGSKRYRFCLEPLRLWWLGRNTL